MANRQTQPRRLFEGIEHSAEGDLELFVGIVGSRRDFSADAVDQIKTNIGVRVRIDGGLARDRHVHLVARIRGATSGVVLSNRAGLPNRSDSLSSVDSVNVHLIFS